jgi:thiol-disulfide isomerase/thioredoxin
VKKNRTALIVGGLVVVVIVAAALAVLLTGGGDDSDDASGEKGEVTLEDGDLEVYPVSITGEWLVPLEDPADDAAVGVAAPVVDGQDYWGGTATVGGSGDNPKVIYFLAHWCPHCNTEVDEIVSLHEAGEIPGGVDISAVSTGVNSEGENYPPSQWLDFKDWPYPVLADSIDSEAVRSYGGNGFPFSVILDSEGNVVARQSGSTSSDQIVAWLESAAAAG